MVEISLQQNEVELGMSSDCSSDLKRPSLHHPKKRAGPACASLRQPQMSKESLKTLKKVKVVERTNKSAKGNGKKFTKHEQWK